MKNKFFSLPFALLFLLSIPSWSQANLNKNVEELQQKINASVRMFSAKKYQESINLTSEAIAIYQDYTGDELAWKIWDLYDLRAQALHRTKQYQAAYISAYTAVSLISDPAIARDNNIDRKKAEFIYTKGIVLESQGKYDDAIYEYTSVLDLNPQHHKAYTQRALCFYLLNKLAEGLNDINKAISINQSFSNYITRGSIRFKQENFTEALTDFDKAISLSPDNGVAYYLHGSTLYELYREEEACKSFKKAIDLGDNNSVYYHKEICGKG